jgi:hypothetical protein
MACIGDWQFFPKFWRQKVFGAREGEQVQKVVRVEQTINIEWSAIMKNDGHSSANASNDENHTIHDAHKPICEISDTEMGVSGDVENIMRDRRSEKIDP